jgi:cathepsin D
MCALTLVLLCVVFASTNAAESANLAIQPRPHAFMGDTWSTYTVDVSFGSPPQVLSVVLDGGLDLLYFFTPNCTQRGCGLRPFVPSKSSTLMLNGTMIDYTYAAGNLHVVGEVARDNGVVGTLKDSQQSFGLINELTQPRYFPDSLDVSGVLGFAFPSAVWSGLSVISGLESNNVSSLVGLWLPTSIYGTGVLSVGAIDTSLYTGVLNYVPLLSSVWARKDYPFFWSNVVDDLLVNGVSNGYCQAHTCNFFVDLAARPMDLGSAIAEIKVDPDCGNLSDLDTYTLIIQGVKYILTPEDYVFKVKNRSNKLICQSGIYGGSKIPFPIPFTLGYTWIQNFYTVLDYDNQQFAFAHSIKASSAKVQ